MYHRIEVKHKEKFNDGRESNLINIIYDDLKIKIDSVKIIDVYNIFGDFTEKEINRLISELFCDPVYQKGSYGFNFAKNEDFNYLIEVSYLPGVTDNVGKTSARGIEYLLGKKIEDNDVRSSKMYLFKSEHKIDIIEKIAKKILCNNLIEKYLLLSKADVLKGTTIEYSKPNAIEITPPYYTVINLNVSDKELISISEKNILALSLEEMKAIASYYNKPEVIKDRKKKNLPPMPTDIELEVFAQTWSEHCKHKIFSSKIKYKDKYREKEIDSLFKTYIKKSTEIIKEKRDDLLSIFIDNAGVVKFNDSHAYCVKVETHNSPSALDPYGGAMTGIVGVNRDIIGTGLGAFPIFNTDVFCFASPFTEEKNVPEGLLHPRRIFRGVHRGIKDGGNESGIPTVNGSITFDDSFLGKPLVFCGTGGLMPLKVNDRDSYKKYTKVGDLIVMCGGRIGKDGIHGATFSSVHLTEESPTSAVQIGDPITQKKMLDFLMEARDLGLYNGITDNGAGGLSSSIGEMAQSTGGAIIDLEKCPLKYQGLLPWEILISEAQERMSLAVPTDKIDKFLELSKKRDVESTIIGEFTNSGFFECRYKGELICSIEMEMLHNGVPKMTLFADWMEIQEERKKEIDKDFKKSVRELLKSPNIASKEYWIRMYDHEVQGRTINKPFSGKNNDGPSDGAVLKIFKDKNEGLVITHGIVPRYSKIDCYHMAANAIDEAFRQAVLLGANPDKIVGLDNFCWPDPVESKSTPDGRYKLAQLVRACEALYNTTIDYNCPCISGKDSMKNDYRKGDIKISVLPTLLFTVVGKIDDIKIMPSFYFKENGDKIYLIGKTYPELGASEYYSIKGINGGIVPKVNTKEAIERYKNLYTAINSNLIKSAHDLSDGGLIIALIESAFSGNMGANVSLDALGDLTDEEKLFSESASRILITVAEKDTNKIEDLFSDDAILLGEVTNKDKIIVKSNDNIILEDNLIQLKEIWKNALIF